MDRRGFFKFVASIGGAAVLGKLLPAQQTGGYMAAPKIVSDLARGPAFTVFSVHNLVPGDMVSVFRTDSEPAECAYFPVDRPTLKIPIHHPYYEETQILVMVRNPEYEAFRANVVTAPAVPETTVFRPLIQERLYG